ncbi:MULTISPECIES: hypothetical protein [Ramlibacter]|uniref:DUF3185 domain-containing protein n=1 Tax=Ramlibacter aquaticus TaxID=2780094 RepID=A0ABR9SH78_9BURK|nr:MULTISPECIES: hypothetical protein [Ramlibacter]MBE7941630.1 hypothetical protein [Ramlibacter aquaticus]
MNGVRLAGVVLILASAAALLWGGFSYTQDTEVAKLGPIELKVREDKRVPIPIWFGVLGVLAGAALLAYGSRKP